MLFVKKSRHYYLLIRGLVTVLVNELSSNLVKKHRHLFKGDRGRGKGERAGGDAASVYGTGVVKVLYRYCLGFLGIV